MKAGLLDRSRARDIFAGINRSGGDLSGETALTSPCLMHGEAAVCSFLPVRCREAAVAGSRQKRKNNKASRVEPKLRLDMELKYVMGLIPPEAVHP